MEWYYRVCPIASRPMEKKVLEEIKELFQSFIAPALEGMRGDLRAIDARIDAVHARIDSLDTKIGALDIKIGALDTKIGALDTKTDTKIDALDTKIGALDTKIESFRRELLAEIHRVEQVLSTEFVRLEQKIDLRLAAMGEKTRPS